MRLDSLVLSILLKDYILISSRLLPLTACAYLPLLGCCILNLQLGLTLCSFLICLSTAYCLFYLLWLCLWLLLL